MEVDQATAKAALTCLNEWLKRPQSYFKDILQVPAIWQGQDDILKALPDAIREHKPIYVASGHSLGKDFIVAGIGLWFLDCYYPSKVIMTAPTERQVKKIMWSETLNHWSNRPTALGGKEFSDPYIEIEKDKHFLIGFTTKESGASKKAQGAKFQGFHSPNIAIIVSEAQAVEDNIFEQIDAISIGQNVLVIYIGNPTRASGRFAKGLRDRDSNIVFNFSCLESPNYKHKKHLIPGLVDYKWVEDKRKRWGEEDPRWFGRVLGQIPPTSIDNVFAQRDIDMALAYNEREVIGTNRGVAIDCAGEGDDENVIYGGLDGKTTRDHVRLHQSPSENAMRTQSIAGELRGNFIIVDCDGLGIGTWQELMNIEGLSDRLVIVKYHGGASTKDMFGEDKLQFQNMRAMAHFIARDRIRRGQAGIPDDRFLIEELLEIKFFENRRGLIQIEDKTDIKERLGRSPDRADAWVMLQWGFEQNYESRSDPGYDGRDRIHRGLREPLTLEEAVGEESDVICGY